MEDRKQIGVFGLKKDLTAKPMSTVVDPTKARPETIPPEEEVLKTDRNCLQCSGNMYPAMH
jgi:hypothetical protein